MSRVSRAEVVATHAVDLTTGMPMEAVLRRRRFGRFGTVIIRSAVSLTELRECVGDLTDELALWQHAMHWDPSVGTWQGEDIDLVECWRLGWRPTS